MLRKINLVVCCLVFFSLQTQASNKQECDVLLSNIIEYQDGNEGKKDLLQLHIDRCNVSYESDILIVENKKSLAFSSKINQLKKVSSYSLFSANQKSINAVDTIPPELVSLNISPQTIDVSSGAQTVIVTASMKDESGMGDARFWFRRPEFGLFNFPETSTEWIYNNETEVYDATFTFVFDETKVAGNWELMTINSIQDFLGNHSSAYDSAAELIKLGFTPLLDVINNNDVDVTPPELVSLNISPQTIDVSSGEQTVIVTASMKDESGMGDTRFWFRRPEFGLFNFPETSTEWFYNNETEVYDATFTFVFDETKVAGNWELMTINSIQDSLGNRSSAYDSAAELIELGFTPLLDVINSNDVDVTPPELVSLNISSQTLDVSSGEQTVIVTASMKDESGMGDARFWFRRPEFGLFNFPETSTEWIYNNETEAYDATFTFVFDETKVAGNWELMTINSIQDSLGNRTSAYDSSTELIELRLNPFLSIDNLSNNTDSKIEIKNDYSQTSQAQVSKFKLTIKDSTSYELWVIANENTSLTAIDFNGASTITNVCSIILNKIKCDFSASNIGSDFNVEVTSTATDLNDFGLSVFLVPNVSEVEQDWASNYVFFPTTDIDEDGLINSEDLDDDNDGVADSEDAFPFDATESIDTDGDGIGNNTDTDDDNDGVLDTMDAFPLDDKKSVNLDVTPPELLSVEFNTTVLDFTEGPQTLTATIAFNDESSIDFARIDLELLSGNNTIVFSNSSANATDIVTIEREFTISEYPSGTFEIQSIRLVDTLGNGKWYTRQELDALNVPDSIIFSGGVEDVAPPELLSVEFNKTVLDFTEGPQTLTATIAFKDESPIDFARIDLELLSGNNTIVFSNSSANATDIVTIEREFTISEYPSGTFEIQSIRLVDTLGNGKWYTRQELDALNVPDSIIFSGGVEDVAPPELLSVEFNKTVLDFTEGPQTLTATIAFNDESPIDFARIDLELLSGNNTIVFSNSSANATDIVTIEREFTLGEYPSGSFEIQSIRLVDSLGNGKWYTRQELDALNVPMSIILSVGGDIDNDGVIDISDAFPLDATETIDTDLDGTGDNADTDDDNDGYSDIDELTNETDPLLDSSVPSDNDGDFISDLMDTDDDNDGYSDEDELANETDSLSADSVPSDNDGDFISDLLDTDDDNDGALDVDDVFPLDDTESVDTDGDDIGNNADTDDDGDGIIDEDDSAPLNASIGDEESPVFSELVDITFEATGTTTDLDLMVPEVFDNNLNAPTVVSDYSEALPLGTHEVIWTATDFAGNVSTAKQLVTIIDTTNPKFDELQIQTIDAMGVLSDISDAINNVQAYDLVEGNINAVVLGDTIYPSGAHLVPVSATDSSGNIVEADVEVHINPLVELSQSRKVEPGATVLLPVTLSGNAAIYPVRITYTLMQSGSIIETSELLIAEDISGVITIAIPNDALDGDVYSVAITTASHAALGFVTSTQLTVDEANFAPTLTLVTLQDDKNISVVNTTNGVVTVTAIVKDINVNDMHDIVWSSLNDALVDLNTDGLASTFEFSAEGLTTDTYELTVSVSESNTSELFSVSVDMDIVIDAALAALDANTDSDNDGISDADEGYGDSDNDGIADYLDTDDNPSRLPIDDSTASMQTVNGLSLSLGDVVTKTDGATAANATVDVNDITSDEHFTTLSSITNFNVSGLTEVGQSVPIVIPLASGDTIAEGSVYRKYSEAKGWFDFVVDNDNGVYSALADEDGNCPYPLSAQYQEGLTVGDNCIQLLIKDGGENDADGLANGMVKDPGVLTSELINQAPVIVVNTDETVNEGSVVTLDASSTTDAESDTLTYQWIQLTGATVELSGQDTATLSFTAPQVSNDEFLTFELTVNDGRDSSTTEVEVLVLQVNIAPTVSIDSHDSSFDEGDSVSLKATGADEDDDTLSYEWEQTSGTTVTLSGASNASVSFTAPTVSSDQNLEFKVTVSDGIDSVSTTTTVTVKNVAPVTPTTPSKESGGGGGSMGWFLVIMSLGVFRNRNIKQAA